MLIAVFSDVHGNFPALQAMVAQAERLGVEEYWNLGDLVGYYPNAWQVVQACAALPGHVIQGNHERMLQAVRAGELALETLDAKYGLGHRQALDQLADHSLRWLERLPVERDLTVDGLTVKLVHGAPGRPDHRVYPDAPRSEFEAMEVPGVDFVFGGHTHYPLVFVGEQSTVVNVGSVGQSRDIGGLANWGLFNSETGVYSHQRTPYDESILTMEVIKMGGPNLDYLLGILIRHRPDLMEDEWT